MSCCKQGDRGTPSVDPIEEKNTASSSCCSSSKPKASTGCCSSYQQDFEEQASGGCCSSSNSKASSGCCSSYEDEGQGGGCCSSQSFDEEKSPEHIHPEMTIQEILSNFPAHSQRLAQELTQVGLQCVGCQAAVYETLELGMKRHGMDDAAVARLTKRLNAILEECSDPTTITLTPRAAKKYLSILEAEGKEGYALRFGDRPAGCSGFEYELDYSEKAQSDDVVYVSEGIEIHVHRGAVARLEGSLIDYIDGLHACGFKVSNQKARSSCGCGSSHNY